MRLTKVTQSANETVFWTTVLLLGNMAAHQNTNIDWILGCLVVFNQSCVDVCTATCLVRLENYFHNNQELLGNSSVSGGVLINNK